jgi:hypothetical protein
MLPAPPPEHEHEDKLGGYDVKHVRADLVALFATLERETMRA